MLNLNIKQKKYFYLTLHVFYATFLHNTVCISLKRAILKTMKKTAIVSCNELEIWNMKINLGKKNLQLFYKFSII